MLYLLIPIILTGIVTVIILPAYYFTLFIWIKDRHNGLEKFSGAQSNELSKKHLIYLVRHAKRRLDILCGSLHFALYDDETRLEIQKALTKHKELKIKILVGPILDAKDGNHPVYEFISEWIRSGIDADRLLLRFLETYPTIGQGRHSDGQLYIELLDGREMTERQFTTYYDYYLPNPGLVREWVEEFDRLWLNESVQCPMATIESMNSMAA